MNPKPVITPDIQQMPLHALVWHPDAIDFGHVVQISSAYRNVEAQQGKFRPAVGGAWFFLSGAFFQTPIDCAVKVELAAAQAFQVLDTDRNSCCPGLPHSNLTAVAGAAVDGAQEHLLQHDHQPMVRPLQCSPPSCFALSLVGSRE